MILLLSIHMDKSLNISRNVPNTSVLLLLLCLFENEINKMYAFWVCKIVFSSFRFLCFNNYYYYCLALFLKLAVYIIVRDIWMRTLSARAHTHTYSRSSQTSFYSIIIISYTYIWIDRCQTIWTRDEIRFS